MSRRPAVPPGPLASAPPPCGGRQRVLTGQPKTFFDFNTDYFRISEVVSIVSESAGSRSHLVVTLRCGQVFRHADYNGSKAKIERRLLDAIERLEG